MPASEPSQRSGLIRADSAAIFGTGPWLRAASATNTAEAVGANYRGHDRVVILTDGRAWVGYRGADPTGQVPASVRSTRGTSRATSTGTARPAKVSGTPSAVS
jgi:hypothetical protein